MIVSIVTISYNQERYLEQAILSVIDQNYEKLEYIVVDPGSTDGSREVIAKYQHRINTVLLEPDDGPADGLNKGFKVATGEILGFLNSDDFLLPGAVRTVVANLKGMPGIDVLSGHAFIVDNHGEIMRKAYSDVFSLRRFAYGVGVLLQPSTFFRKCMYEKTDGFNRNNRSNWDAELYLDMSLKGARFKRINSFLSAYRLHAHSITGSNRLDERIRAFDTLRFRKIMGRNKEWHDSFLYNFYKIIRYVTNPLDVYERIMHGPIYGRQEISQ